MPGDKGGKTKHDRCVEHVQENSPNVGNAHAVCVAQGVEPASWSKDMKKKDKMDFDKDGKLDEHEKHHKKLEDEHKKLKKADLIKALADAGERESALLLKNWGEMDSTAELFKSKLEKNAMMGYDSKPDVAGAGVNMAKEEKDKNKDEK